MDQTNPKLDFIGQICGIVGFTPEETEELRNAYDDNLNFNLLKFSGITKKEMGEIKSGLTDENQWFASIWETIKDREGLKEKFQEYSNQYHRELIVTIMKNATEEQQAKLKKYFAEYIELLKETGKKIEENNI